MLPYFVGLDFQEVLEELTEAGYPFEQDWFASHFEFRFPFIGKVTQRGVEMELRQAIEPWHVLGEEPTGGATVRHVDSSVERVQIRVRGMTDPRYIITCNGRRVPLHPTGTPGEFVAGVRFRAWQPPSCLHPTIGVQAPLVFDLYDSWNQRSVGGCSWHVAHPAAAALTRFRSMPTKPKAGAWPDSTRSDIPPADGPRPATSATANTHSRSICGVRSTPRAWTKPADTNTDEGRIGFPGCFAHRLQLVSPPAATG